MHSLVQPDAWVALKLPTGNLRVLQVTPNTTISLGKYGSFPTNLIIHRPYHLTYELEDKREPETFNRLRIVPASELYHDILSSSSFLSPDSPGPSPDDDAGDEALPTGVEYALVDETSGAVVAKTDQAELDASARQTLTMLEIEELKKDATDAGRDLIAKLMLSHTAMDQKTEYSLAKYKLLKTKKYIRRFCVLPLDVSMLDYWMLEEKDPIKIMELREEMIGLLGCWANVHFGGEDRCLDAGQEAGAQGDENGAHLQTTPGRWLVVDDTGGLLVAAMAERMGTLYPAEDGDEGNQVPQKRRRESIHDSTPTIDTEGELAATSSRPSSPNPPEAENEEDGPRQVAAAKPKKYPTGDSKHQDDMQVPYAQSNTMTIIHHNSQPNLTYLRYYDFDITSPTQSLAHPLARHLMTLSWLQLLDPTADTTYMAEPSHVTPDELKTWKANRRGNYHRKRRRWARIRHVVDGARSGGFSGLVVASTMDPISIMRHAVPLLAGGAPIAIYTQSPEPLTALVDCYSVARRAAWISNPPEEAVGKTAEELEQWAGNDEFPLNPTLVLGAAMQTSRVRKWQVLPGRTHPLMTSKGGAEGYIFTAWRVKPAEGKVEARGKGRSRKAKTAK